MTISNLLAIAAILILAESGGRDHVVGDGGRALGCLQIHQCVIDDVNTILGRCEFAPADRLNRGRSIALFLHYQRRYATRERLGRRPTAEDVVRIWNGGPDGHRQIRETDHAWRRFLRALRRSQ